MKAITLAARDDIKVQNRLNFVYYQGAKDRNHAQRRQQQRAINNLMIAITLTYGKKQRSHGDFTYTLTDRQLKKSPYAKFIHELRGLKVVCCQKEKSGIFEVITTYWNTKVIRRARK